MKHRSRLFLLSFAGVAALVLVLGALVVWPAAAYAVGIGVGIAILFQLIVFWLLGMVLFPTRPVLVYGLGLAGRLLVVGAIALLAPGFGLPLAPVLLTLVTVFALTTLLEPIFLQLEPKSAA